jgi:histidyl-tRNA synthetase
MSESGSSSGGGQDAIGQRIPAGALEARWVRAAWRRAAMIHAFDEVDALRRIDEPPSSGAGVDLSAVVSRHVLAGAPADPSGRWYTVRHWTDTETPQRGRSPEFWALSCRIVGDESVRADAESIACAIGALRVLGLTPQHVKVRISHRDAVRALLVRRGVDAESLDAWFPLLHRAGKMSNDDFISEAVELGMEARTAVDVLRVLTMSTPFEAPTTQLFLSEQSGGRGPEYFKALFAELRAAGVDQWCVLNLGVVRAGAHHTGMVFEVHDASGRARSLAAGGRSEFERAGTVHAVGFDMGDTALLEVLRGAGLFPPLGAMAEGLGARADVFIAAPDDPDAQASLAIAVGELRRAGLATRTPGGSVASFQEMLVRARTAGPVGARRAVYVDPSRGPGMAWVSDADRPGVEPRLVPVSDLTSFLRS